jgi:hypothetical protein
MALALARFRQSGTQRSNATNWPNALTQGWFNVTEKPSSLVTHNTSGTPTVSSFTLLAPGAWQIGAGVKFSSVSYLYISRNSAAAGNAMVSSGQLANPSCDITREFNYNDVIYVMYLPSASSTMDQGDAINFVSLTYLGAI